MNRVCILIPYFGKWPAHFAPFLESCRYNSTLTFLIFTNLQPPSVVPPNVQFHHATLVDIKRKLDAVLGFEAAPLSPYKLCDVRPAFGLIFREYIRDFDFWGWGDIDVLFGRVDAFGITHLLTSYDVISFRQHWISGSFCILKNDTRINTLFLTSSDLRKVYLDPRHLCFDEISFCWDAAANSPIEEIEFPHDNFTKIVIEAATKNTLRVHFKDLLKESIPRGGYLVWDRGRIFDHEGNEHLLYHYVTEKKKPYFKNDGFKNVAEKFYIDRAGFYSEDEFRNRKLIGLVRVLTSVPTLVMQLVYKVRKRAKKISQAIFE